MAVGTERQLGSTADLGNLGDAARFHEPLVLPAADHVWLVGAPRTMVLIRAAEE